MAKAKTKLVTSRKTDDGEVYDFRCPYPSGCGQAGGDPFSSTGWAKREHAVARGKQHIHEHDTAGNPEVETEPMPSLNDFREAHNLTAATAGQAVNPDDWEF